MVANFLAIAMDDCDDDPRGGTDGQKYSYMFSKPDEVMLVNFADNFSGICQGADDPLFASVVQLVIS